MPASECVYCGDDVCGEISGIVPTLCCVACCKRVVGLYPSNSFPRVELCVSRTYARKKLGCWHPVTEVSKRKFENDATNLSVRYTNLFLFAEVAHLAKRRRLEQFKRAVPIQLKTTDPVVRHFLLGDFIKDPISSQSWRAQFESILRRCEVLDRATEIVQSCKGAHPQAAFDFCLDNPEKGVKEFQELKEKMCSVFRLEGTRIISKLPKSDREKLQGTPLEDVHDRFKKDLPIYFRRRLINWVSEETADEIVADFVYQLQLTPDEDEVEIAMKLLKFWQGNYKLDQASSVQGN